MKQQPTVQYDSDDASNEQQQAGPAFPCQLISSCHFRIYALRDAVLVTW